MGIACQKQLLALITLCYSVQLCLQHHSNSVSGPFDVEFNRVEACPPRRDSNPPTIISLRARRDTTSRNIWYLSGNTTISYPITDTGKAVLRVASWSERGGWKDNAHVWHFKRPCTAGRIYIPKVYQDIMANIFNDSDKFCPFAAGTYRMNNYRVDLSVADNFPVFFYGKWRGDIYQAHEVTNKTIACVRIYVTTVPKRSAPPTM